MTDEQFDEICRSALAYDPGAASEPTWSKIRRRPRWSWLPTIPETLTCGLACGFILFVFWVQLGHKTGLPTDSNPVVQKAVGGSLAVLQASTLQVPDTTQWTEASLGFPRVIGSEARKGR